MLTRASPQTRSAAAAKTKAVDETRKPSLAEGVYQSIKQDIFDFRLLPGDRFTEGQVASRLNVSRTPVREGLQRLEKEGYLHVHFRAGWSVRAHLARLEQHGCVTADGDHFTLKV